MRLLSRVETVEEREAREALEHDEAVREARVKAARSCKRWTEIDPPERLCPRGPARLGWKVDSVSDNIYTLYRGTVFHSRSANIIADQAEIFFVVVDGDVVVYERLTSPATWSQFVERQTRRGLKAAGAKAPS